MSSALANEEWVEVGPLEDIPRLGARVVRGPSGNVAIFRTATDEVYALADRCPHRGGPLSQGIVFGGRVACPLHDWVVELSTGNAVAPDVGCTQTYAVRLENGVVSVLLIDPPSVARHSPTRCLPGVAGES
jgi:nitrite reductase (NADH) small subunit